MPHRNLDLSNMHGKDQRPATTKVYSPVKNGDRSMKKCDCRFPSPILAKDCSAWYCTDCKNKLRDNFFYLHKQRLAEERRKKFGQDAGAPQPPPGPSASSPERPTQREPTMPAGEKPKKKHKYMNFSATQTVRNRKARMNRNDR